MSPRTFVPTPDLDEYSRRFADYFTFERRDDGVLLVKGHTNGGPIRWSEDGDFDWKVSLKLIWDREAPLADVVHEYNHPLGRVHQLGRRWFWHTHDTRRL